MSSNPNVKRFRALAARVGGVVDYAVDDLGELLITLIPGAQLRICCMALPDKLHEVESYVLALKAVPFERK